MIDISKMKTVSIKRGCMSGDACLTKHRITIAQLLRHLADGDTVQEVEDSYYLDKHEFRRFIRELAVQFDRESLWERDNGNTNKQKTRT